jgi:hypothetical protein
VPRRDRALMELVSYIAGERWSDHPACTHPVLAALARHVNDSMSDEARPRLAVLVPSMIGLTGNDPHIEVQVDNGEVTLTGTVDDRRTKRLTEDIAESVYGVKDVHNRLRVQDRIETNQQRGTTST